MRVMEFVEPHDNCPAAEIEDAVNPEWHDTIIDDPLLQYIRDIAEFPLLNASQERVLGQKIAGERRLAHMEGLCVARQESHSRIVNVAVAILEHICKALPSVRLLCADLGLPNEALASDMLCCPKIQDIIHGPAPPELLISMAQRCGKSPDELADMLGNLWLDFNLVPPDMIRATMDPEWGRRKMGYKANQSVLDVVLPYERAIESHFNNVREEAGKAREELIVANLRLVIVKAKKYVGHGAALTLMDLIQEGNVGLMRAADKFDYRKGYKFSTYATLWIRQAMGHAVRKQGSPIPLSAYAAERSRQLQNLQVKLSHEFGRQPTIEEMANKLGVDPQKIECIMEITNRMTVSLYSPGSGDEDTSWLADLIECPGENTSDLACQLLFQEQVQEDLDSLSEKERRVLQLRFGLHDGYEHTLSEIGALLNITGERARVIQANAIKQLRHSWR